MTQSLSGSPSAGFTPGPWRIDDEHDDYVISIVGRPSWGCCRFGVKGEWDIARMEVLDGRSAETTANARLMGAGPDMVAALVALNMVRPANWDDADDPSTVAAWRQLDTALAKAGIQS